jgi:hypothetical protein
MAQYRLINGAVFYLETKAQVALSRKYHQFKNR